MVAEITLLDVREPLHGCTAVGRGGEEERRM